VNPTSLTLARAQRRLVERLDRLEQRLDAGDDAAWAEYCEAAAALAVIAPLTVPGADRVMTTQELADTFSLSPRTARRKGLKGELPAKPIRLGPGDRAKLRWAAR